jgi:hypothetical protein
MDPNTRSTGSNQRRANLSDCFRRFTPDYDSHGVGARPVVVIKVEQLLDECLGRSRRGSLVNLDTPNEAVLNRFTHRVAEHVVEIHIEQLEIVSVWCRGEDDAGTADRSHDIPPHWGRLVVALVKN